MKKRVLLVCVVAIALYGDELERIDALVDEIHDLRTGYERCQRELSLSVERSETTPNDRKLLECESALHKLSRSSATEVQKLRSEIKKLKNRVAEFKKSSTMQASRIRNLKKELQKYKKALRVKQKVTRGKTKTKSERIIGKTPLCPVETVVVKEKQKRTRIALDSEGKVVIKESYRVVTTRPRTFRTLRDAVIFDKPGGVRVDLWEKGRSFTSYLESGSWIKITGYFVNRKWKKSNKEMWIKKSDAFERD